MADLVSKLHPPLEVLSLTSLKPYFLSQYCKYCHFQHKVFVNPAAHVMNSVFHILVTDSTYGCINNRRTQQASQVDLMAQAVVIYIEDISIRRYGSRVAPHYENISVCHFGPQVALRTCKRKAGSFKVQMSSS